MKPLLILIAVVSMFLVGCSGPAPVPTPTVTVTAEAPKPSPAPTVTVAPPERSTPSPASPKSLAGTGAMTDAEFEEFVKEARPRLANETRADIVAFVSSVCGAFERGATKDQVFEVLENGAKPLDMGYLAGAGVRIYCPEYAKDLEGTR